MQAFWIYWEYALETFLVCYEITKMLFQNVELSVFKNNVRWAARQTREHYAIHKSADEASINIHNKFLI